MSSLLPTPREVSIGNDVVDLADERCAAKHADDRFLARIFTPAERESILASAEPERTLWIHWAAKEAAFKVVSKLRGAAPVFRHRAFEVTFDGAAAGVVRFARSTVAFRVESPSDPLHVVAVGPSAGGWPEAGWEIVFGGARLPDPGSPRAPTPADLVRLFSARELPAVRDLASARVRLDARARLAVALDLAESRLEIVCAPGPLGRSPPSVLVDGRPAEADVSLSHHGAWVAWAILAPRP